MQHINLIHLPETDFLVLANDLNLTPKIIAQKTLRIEEELANLPCVKALKQWDFVLDVGCFMDTPAIFGASGATVYGFEAQLDAALCAMWNFRNHPNINIVHGAVGDGSPVTCNQDPLNGNLGTRTVSKTENGTPTMRLDSLGFRNVTILKADTEGQEASVLRGARETIGRCKPTLIIEIYHDLLARAGSGAEEVYDLLRGLGYKWEVCIGTSEDPRFDILATPQ